VWQINYRLDNEEITVQFPDRAKNFSLFQIIETTSGDHPASTTCLNGEHGNFTFISGNFEKGMELSSIYAQIICRTYMAEVFVPSRGTL
jgi:hypothetical protein